ncbi:MAG: serine protease [Verrucomicrobiae bacterium]|nr:serine protease [Verrucomicrobiae bacterium]
MQNSWRTRGMRGAMALTLVAGAACGGAELSPPEVYDRVVASTLALRVTDANGERFVGAGFLAFRPDRVVTAWHVVRGVREIEATYSDGTRAEVLGVVGHSERHDLALLEVRPTARTPLTMRQDDPRIASRLYAIGSPRGYSFSISDGLLSQVRMIDGFPQYQLTCAFSPGNSGGPVVDGFGEVVGVSAWSKVGGQNLNFAIPARFVTRLHSEAGGDGAVGEVGGGGIPHGERGAGPSGYAQFLEWLSVRAGHEVTVSVVAGDEVQRFRWVMPEAEASAEPSAARAESAARESGAGAGPVGSE